MSLVAWLRPLAYRHKKLCAHGKGPGDARSKNKKIKYLAIERQIEKRDPKPFKWIYDWLKNPSIF